MTEVERIVFRAVNQYTLLAKVFARATATGGAAPIPLEDTIRTWRCSTRSRSAASGRWEDRLDAP